MTPGEASAERATWDPAMFSDKVDVVYHGMPTSSFNNRFLPIPGVKTDAILSIDDDILTSCDNIQDAFEVTLPAGFWKCLDMQVGLALSLGSPRKITPRKCTSCLMYLSWVGQQADDDSGCRMRMSSSAK